MATAFRTVLRGYEPAQVDAEVATLEQALTGYRGPRCARLRSHRGRGGLSAGRG